MYLRLKGNKSVNKARALKAVTIKQFLIIKKSKRNDKICESQFAEG